ncbi:hypothetical protein, partial [Nocardioides sp.]|uniref:hypothetical protein n=1 Tax=Nocardioides sp. TaxID=35761 RepID=UPI003564C64B
DLPVVVADCNHKWQVSGHFGNHNWQVGGLMPGRSGTSTGMDTNENAHEIQDSNANANGPEGAAGDLGISSERIGQTGPGQMSTDGVRDTSPVDRDLDDVPPEQAPGGAEENPEGLDPKAGYSSTDPRSP